VVVRGHDSEALAVVLPLPLPERSFFLERVVPVCSYLQLVKLRYDSFVSGADSSDVEDFENLVFPLEQYVDVHDYDIHPVSLHHCTHLLFCIPPVPVAKLARCSLVEPLRWRWRHSS